MKSFLSEIVDHLFNSYQPEELQDIALVMPSRRSGLHLKTEIAQRIDQHIWAPEIITLDDFLSGLHEQEPIDSISVHFELYTCYKTLFENAGNFDSFHSWSSQILNDFNEIDRYLLSQKDVFKNLKDIKEIESWSFNAEELSEGQKKFLEFWEKLGELYVLFYRHLSQKGFCTHGKIYKDIASSPEKYLGKISHKQIYFIGFNALSKSEQTIFSYLNSLGKAQVFWDIDQYYMNDRLQEAGNFIRGYKNWNSEAFEKVPNNLIQEDKNIFIHPASTNLNQVVTAAKILGQKPDFSHHKSALLLADEQLLQPMLNALPESIDRLNITMGYSLRNTLSMELLDTLFEIKINSKRFQSSRKNTIYYKDLFKFLEHPLVYQYLETKSIDSEKIVSHFTRFNYSFITRQNLAEVSNDQGELFDILFFNGSETIKALIQSISDFLNKVRLTLLESEYSTIEVEALYKIISTLNKIEILNQQYGYLETIEGTRKLFGIVGKDEKLSFYGEPLEGLQMMGLLESRAIDFENVILLSCNEKFLPGVHAQNSFIPHDLKVYLGLPTKHDREAIFSYYFYRLFHRSKNIHLVYNNGLPNELDSNEISRYLIQVSNELPQEVKTIEHSFAWSNENRSGQVEKEPSTLLKIDQFIEKGISPSALNGYLACPQDFYYKYLLRISEKEALEENIEASTLGDIVHKVLEDLYEAHLPIITESKVDLMMKDYEALTEKQYNEHFPSKNYRYGKNLLQYKMALKSIKEFLTREKKSIKANGPIEILGLEMELKTSLEIETEDGVKQAILKGKADRIDKQNGKIRIIDYKSGFVKPDQVNTSSISKVFDKAKACQLLFYTYLYFRNHPDVMVDSGIISMRNLKAGFIKYELKENRKSVELNEMHLAEFELKLIEVIQEMYDSSLPFTHSPDAKYCMMC